MRDFDDAGREPDLAYTDDDVVTGPMIALRLEPVLKVTEIESLEAVIISRQKPVWDAAQVDLLRRTIRRIATGHLACKFLVLDLSSSEDGSARPPTGFDECIDEVSNLIVEAPVISIAWARGLLAGADLEMALACSMMVGEAGAALSFERDLVNSLRSYSLLAHKVGFVQAERLMENGTVLDAKAAHDLMLLHSVVPQSSHFDGIRQFVTARTRRHNSSCGIYRAQRIAMLHA